MLAQFKAIEYPSKDFELVVVNNDPTDQATAKVVKQLQKQIKSLRYATESQKGASPARNRGAKLAKWPHLIFVDDDMELSTQFLKGYEAAWKKYPRARLLGGGIIAKVPQAQLTAHQKDLVSRYSWCFGQTYYESSDEVLSLGNLLFSGNMSYKQAKKQQSVFHPKLGVYSYGLGRIGGEDFEISTRTLLQHESVIYIGDDRLKISQELPVERFTDDYVARRHFMSGIELAAQEHYIKQQFPSFKSFYLRRWRQWDELKRLLPSRFEWIMLMSYLLNRKQFI